MSDSFKNTQISAFSPEEHKSMYSLLQAMRYKHRDNLIIDGVISRGENARGIAEESWMKKNLYTWKDLEPDLKNIVESDAESEPVCLPSCENSMEEWMSHKAAIIEEWLLNKTGFDMRSWGTLTATVVGLVTAITCAMGLKNYLSTQDDNEGAQIGEVVDLQAYTKKQIKARNQRKRRMDKTLRRSKLRVNNAFDENLESSTDEEYLSAASGDLDESDTEMFGDEKAYGGIYERVRNNTVILHNSVGTLSGFIAKGSILCTTTHFFRRNVEEGYRWMHEGEIFSIHLRGQKYKIPFDQTKLVVTTDGDETYELCMYDLGCYVPPSKDLTRYFLTSEELAGITNADLSIARTDGKGNVKYSHLGFATLRRERRTFVSSMGAKGVVANGYVPAAFQYHPGLEDGSCGSLILRHTKSPNKIVGTHFGSTYNNQSGFAIPLDRKVVESMLSKFAEIIVDSGPIPWTIDQMNLPPQIPDYTPLGTLSGKASPMPTKTGFRPSVFNGNVEGLNPAVGLAVMHDSDVRLNGHTMKDVYHNELKKCKGYKPLDPVILRNCVDGTTEEIMATNSCDNFVRRNLTLEEAINGSEDFANLNSMAMAPSAGHPWINHKPWGATSGKRFLFDQRDNGTYQLSHKPLAEHLVWSDERIRSGLAIKPIWTYSGKSEGRPIEKLEGPAPFCPKTRVICVGPVHLLILYRIYFGAYANYFHAISKNGGFSAIGMNVYSRDWDRMLKRFLEVCDLGADGDYSGYEGIIGPQAYEAFLETVTKFYEDSNGQFEQPVDDGQFFSSFGVHWTWSEATNEVESYRARKALLLSALHAYVRLGRDVYMKHYGNASGNFITAIINTFWGNVLLRYTWHVSLSEHELMAKYANNATFDAMVRVMIMGDDNAYTVAPEFQQYFNARVHQEVMARYGYKYTAANKTDEVTADFKPITDVEFLKGTTVISSRIAGVKYMHFAEERSIQKMLMYVSDKLDTMEASVINANACLMRLYTSGPVRFGLWKRKLESTLRKQGFTGHLISYLDCESRFIKDALEPDITGPDVELLLDYTLPRRPQPPNGRRPQLV